MYTVYFIINEKNKVYVGSTSKVPLERLKDHNIGTNKFTRDNGPWKLLYYESYHCKLDALTREKFYKMGFGQQIKKIIIERLMNKLV